MLGQTLSIASREGGGHVDRDQRCASIEVPSKSHVVICAGAEVVVPTEGATEVADVTMEETKLSRKGLLKMMKVREGRRKKRKTKRLGGKKAHSKW